MESTGEWHHSNGRRVLLDQGAGSIKCSLGTETSKPHITLCAAGRHKKTQKVYLGNKLRDEFERGSGSNLEVSHPLVRGLWHDTDVLGALWKHEFAKIGGKKFDE